MATEFDGSHIFPSVVYERERINNIIASTTKILIKNTFREVKATEEDE